MQTHGVTANDALVGIAASGRTPYTNGAIEAARKLGCFTVGLTCVPNSEITKEAEIAIVPYVGAEAITGSTRMKAGSAQKMVLNMISTAAMIRLGYVKGNRMTNVRASNEKLKDRSLRILMEEAGLDEEAARARLAEGTGDLRVAVVMIHANVSRHEAEKALVANNFVIEKAISFLTGK